MEDNFRDAFQEVYYIIENYDKNSVDKISTEFIEYIENNRNENYKVKIDLSISLDSQELLYETKVILAWIYQEYFANKEEKRKFKESNLKFYLEEEEEKKKKYKEKITLKEKSNKEIKDKKINEIDNKIIEKTKENGLLSFIKKIISKIFRGK